MTSADDQGSGVDVGPDCLPRIMEDVEWVVGNVGLVLAALKGNEEDGGACDEELVSFHAQLGIVRVRVEDWLKKNMKPVESEGEVVVPRDPVMGGFHARFECFTRVYGGTSREFAAKVRDVAERHGLILDIAGGVSGETYELKDFLWASFGVNNLNVRLGVKYFEVDGQPIVSLFYKDNEDKVHPFEGIDVFTEQQIRKG